MKLLSIKNLIISILLGLFGFFLVYNEVYFVLPETNLLTDLREIFVTISAALFGPISAIIVSVLTSLYDPYPELIPYIILQHIVPSVLLSFYYKKFVYQKLAMPILIVGWMFGIFLYYFVFYLPVFIATYYLIPGFFDYLITNEQGYFGLNEAINLFVGWIPEAVFTTIFTSLVLIALPEQYRKPDWGKVLKSEITDRRKYEYFNRFKFRNSLAIRLAIWFLLLAIFPILVIGVAIKKDMTHTLLLNEANMRSDIVENIKHIADRFTDSQAIDFLTRIKQNVKGETFFVDTDGNYAFSLDSSKTGTSISKDYPKDIVQKIISQKNGMLTDLNNERSFAFGQVKIQNTDLIIVTISNPVKIQNLLTDLSNEVNNKLLIGIVIISLALIGIIWMLIQLPLKEVSKTIDKISEGKFDVRVDTENLIDEIKYLGSAFNTMANKITSSEKRFREMAELLPQTLFESDLSGKLTYTNQNGFKLFEYSREDIEKGINVLDFLHQSDQLRASENIRKIFKRELVKGNEYLAVKKNGVTFPTIIYTTYFEENGKISGLRGILVDITNLKLAEDSLKASEEKFRSIINALKDMIFIAETDGKISYVSPSATQILGYEEKELIGKKAFDFIHPDDIAFTAIELTKVANNTNEQKAILYRVRQKSGNYIYLESVGINLLSNKVVNGLVIISRDVTERIKYEKQLSESESKLKESQKVAKLGHYEFNIKSGIWTSSEGLDEIFGIDETFYHNLEGWIDLIYVEDRNKMSKYLNNHVIKSKNSFNKEYRVLRYSDKKIIWVHGLGNLEFDNEGAAVKMFGTIQDITERKKAQNILFNSEQRFKYTWENTLDAMRLTDEAGKIVLVNKAYCDLVEKSRAQLEGFNLSEAFLDEFKVEVRSNYISKFKKQSLASRYECSIELWNKKVIYVQVAHTYLNIPDQPTLLLSVFHNITDRKIAEDYLKESEEKFRHAFDYSATGVVILDLNGKFQKVNSSFTNMIGYSENELKKLSFLDITYSDDAHTSGNVLNELLSGIINYTSFEKRYLTKSNKIIWGFISTSIVRDINGKPQFFISQIIDITERKTAEESVRRLSLAVEQSPAIIMITEINGSIVYVNPKFTEVTGYSLEEVIGANPRILKSGYSSEEQYSHLWKTIKSGEEWRGEFYNRKKNGEFYWESAFISPIFGESGSIINFLAVKEDITERKKLLADLIEAKQKAEEMNKIKSYFFANMSHELRTPFVGIMGFSELLSESLQNPEERNMALQILKSSKRLTDTLNKILNVTRIESHSMELKPENFNACRLIRDIVILYSTSAQIKGTSIKAECSEESIVINTDPKILEDILNNLVSNAIKFTENGFITLSVNKINERATNYIIIKVEDTGIGIPKEKQEIVWQEFRQASEGFNRSFEGTGLGLTITKKYVKILGGDIFLESEEGTGTTFSIKIPVGNTVDNAKLQEDNSAEIKSNNIQKPNSSKPKILYVEDDMTSLQYVNIILRSISEVDTAFDAATALQLADKNNYDIMMLDINLGKGMDGLELMQRIRKLGRNQNTPFVAITAYASETDKNEFLDKGFSHYISKPFSSQELRNLINQIFS